MSFIYCHLNYHANLLRPWRFPLITTQTGIRIFHHVHSYYNYTHNKQEAEIFMNKKKRKVSEYDSK